MDLSDAFDRGITVTEISAVDQPIDVARETTAAFVGRALRGPLDSPVLLHHFGEFRRCFGDVWARSGLGPAVRHFFEHGGKRLYVVRVANGARGALVCLPAGGSALVLRAVQPGSSERIRAAVDYDAIDDDVHFNLTLQRIDPQSGLVTDQEIYRQLGFEAHDDAFVGDALAASAIARMELPYPTHRPDATVDDSSRFDLEWTEAAQPGTDGEALTDYDLVGSRRRGTGLFALEGVEHFDLLYLPPIGKHLDPGPAALLAAELYCRERGAMLIVDPPSRATSAADAIRCVEERGYASPNMMSYFPRVIIRGDGDDDRTPRVAGAAIAGLFCKLDRHFGPWADMCADALGLNRAIRPAIDVAPDESEALIRAGINVVASGALGRAHVDGGVTMGRGSESHRVFANLSVRRLSLRIVNAIDLATRWCVFEQPDARLTARIQGQVSAYLAHLYEIGALANDRYVVQCGAGVAKRSDCGEHGVEILFAFHPTGSPEPVSLTLHQGVGGCLTTTTAFAPAAQRCA